MKIHCVLSLLCSLALACPLVAASESTRQESDPAKTNPFVVLATLNVLDFGADPTGVRTSHAEIGQAVAKARPGETVFFPKGRYLLRKGIWVGEKRYLTLRGEPGTVLVMHCNPAGDEREASGAFDIYRSEDLAISNFTVTTDNPIGCVGTVLATDDAAHTLDVRIGETCPLVGNEHFFQLNTYDAERSPDNALETHQKIEKRIRPDGTEAYEGLPYTWLKPRVARITVPNRVKLTAVTNGHRVLVRYFREGMMPIHAQGVKRLRIENFEIERTPSTGSIIAPPSADVTFRRFCLRPRADDPYVCASNADGVHVVACGGKIEFKDCHFDGLGDDAINVHSMGGEVTEFDPASGRIVFIGRGVDRKPQKIYGDWAAAGDELEFYSAKTMVLVGKAKLRKFSDRTGEGELESGGYRPQVGDFAANGSFRPAVHLANCSFRNTRARGVLLQTRDVLVENCSFYGLRFAGLLLACDMLLWNEMGPVASVEVRNCRFAKCARLNRGQGHCQGALAVKGCHEMNLCTYPAGVHRDIRIFDNSFANIGCEPIFVEATDGLEVRGNRYSDCGNDPDLPQEQKATPVRVSRCANVKIDRNEY